jgi:V8-like Glu-specific endopeptidase
MKALDRNAPLALLLLISMSACTHDPKVVDHDWGEGTPNFAPAQPLNNGGGQYAHWQSIGRVNVEGGATCTGTLIDTRAANDDRSGPAYVLTSGHCAKGDSNRYIENAPASGLVTFNFFQDTQALQRPYPIVRIAWSTMRGHDIAILELDRSLGQLMNDGITPLKLASHPPVPGSDLLIVGAPVDGYLQRAACPQEHQADVFEASWTWPNQLSNRCQDVKAGVSGSPLLTRYSTEIVAVIGTTTRDSGRSRCSRNAPCEVSNGLAIKRMDTNYATPTNDLAPCFSAGRFDPRSGDCMLGPATNFEPQFGESYLRMVRNEQGEFIPLWWEQFFAVDQPFYRVKYTRTLADCRIDEGYGAVQSSHESGSDSSRHELRDGPGFYFMCIVGQRYKAGPAGRWDARNAKIYWRWALAEPTNTAPVYRLFESAENEFTVQPFGVTPDLDVSQYEYKSGPLNAVNCLEPEGYQTVRPPLLEFQVSIADGPKKVCLKGKDMAGNPSPEVDFQLPERNQ